MLLAFALSAGLILQEAPERRSIEDEEAQSTSAIFSQTYRNWHVDCDLPGIRDMRIAFDVELDENGAMVGQPVPVGPQSTPTYRAAADSARRALLNSAPFEVPDGYQGGVYRPTFAPGRVCIEADED